MPERGKYTLDGVHFFRTKAKLEKWMQEREAGVSVAGPVLSTPPPKLSCVDETLPSAREGSSTPYVARIDPFSPPKLTPFRVFREDDGSLDFWSEDEKESASGNLIPTPKRIEKPRVRPSQDKFQPGDVVVYQSTEGAGERAFVERTGVVLSNSGQRRRGDLQPTFHRVRWEMGGQSGVEAVAEARMEYPRENKDRKLRTALERVFLTGLRRGFDGWKRVLVEQRAAERRLCATIRLQAIFRGTRGAKHVGMLREQRMILEMKQRRAERLRKKKENAEKKKRKIESRKRKVGVTIDGVNFFMNKAELEEFYKRKRKACNLAYKAIERMSLGKIRSAFRTWVHYVKSVLPPAHLDMDGLMSDGLRDIVAGSDIVGEKIVHVMKTKANDATGMMLQTRQAQAKIAPWHPSCEIKLPGLPDPGVKQMPDGRYRVINISRFNSFKKYQGGPTDFCSFLVRGVRTQIMFGAYPSGQSRIKAKKITSRSSSVSQILVAGADTFVSLLSQEEIAARAAEHVDGWTYDIEVDTTCANIRSELITGLKSTKEALRFAEKRAQRGREVGYARAQQEALDRAVESRGMDYQRAQRFFDNFAEKVQHVHMSIPKDGIVDDEKMTELCENLERRIRAGERLYLFSNDGNGRVAVLATILLGRLYGLDPETAAERVKLHHQAQGRFLLRRAPKTHFYLPTFPQCPAQRIQITRVLMRIEPSYNAIRRRGGRAGEEDKKLEALEDVVLWEERHHERAVGVPPIMDASYQIFSRLHLPEIPRLDFTKIGKKK